MTAIPPHIKHSGLTNPKTYTTVPKKENPAATNDNKT